MNQISICCLCAATCSVMNAFILGTLFNRHEAPPSICKPEVSAAPEKIIEIAPIKGIPPGMPTGGGGGGGGYRYMEPEHTPIIYIINRNKKVTFK